MDYKKINNYLGWLIFIIATTVYFITLEDTVSLWDCGEYVTAAYKLEVGHPPGAPTFMVLGRLASFFADPENVAVWINRLSALSSSATILFMFWSITLLVKKIILSRKSELDAGDKVAIFSSAVVGSLAYTFSDSFWFSAVEGEVYAMSSLFTAVIYWAALRWDEEMLKIQNGFLHPKGYSPDRWMLFIMFMLGLAIGVHLLGILVVPAIAYIIYFRYGAVSKRFLITLLILMGAGVIIIGIGDGIKAAFGLVAMVAIGALLYAFSLRSKIGEFLLVGFIGVAILNFIQNIVITGTIALASKLEVGFVNTLGLPFYSGAIFTLAVLVFGFFFLLRRARSRGMRSAYSAGMGLILLLIGYGSFAVIVIRSNANTPLDENDPSSLVTLHSYLKREQYGSAPLAYGPYWNSQESGGTWEATANGAKRWSAGNDRSAWEDQSPVHLRRFVVMKNDDVIKAFENENNAKEFAKSESGSEVVEKYFESNAETRLNATPTYSQNTLFPRMYWSAESARINSYKEWSGYDDSEEAGTELGKDNRRLPTFGENLRFFFRYQVNWMYTRYFMWNFAGRQNDIQGSRGGAMRGNWKSGFSFIDSERLGDQTEAPYFTTQNDSNNKFYLLPLVLGLIGLFFHFYRSPKGAFVLLLAFLFTGIAIVVYLNQKPLEPRERDYAYAGSFYFFAMWIGLGVYGLFDTFRSFNQDMGKKLAYSAAGLFLAVLIYGTIVGSAYTSLLTYFTVLVIAGLLIGLMVMLGRGMKQSIRGASIAGVLSLFIPIIMGYQGWDDHDRSLKTSAHDLAYNYLVSCGNGKNGIIFTNGDNDTFPLWYMQEVEEKFTDVRVCNLSLMQTDWYTNQMKMKAYESEPLPIRFTEDQILMHYGGTDQVLFSGIIDLLYNGADKEIVEKMVRLRAKVNPKEARAAGERLITSIPQVLSGAKSNSPALDKQLRQYSSIAAQPIDSTDMAKSVFEKIYIGYKVLSAVNSRAVQIDEENYALLRRDVIDFEDGWDVTDLRDAMEFVRDDKNMVAFGANQLLRIFPSTGFVMPVNDKNLVSSGLVTKDQLDDCAKEIKFRFKYDSQKDRLPQSIVRQLNQNGLTREQVMMLDIIANNNWKRPLYFSSPSGSEVSLALLYGYSGTASDGHIKQNGMAFELTPLQGSSARINRDRMYDNLMNKYHYGQMSNPDVLTDYYTRRHTIQYRSHFLRLAQEYATDAARAEDFYSQMGGNDGKTVPGLPTKEEIKEYKKRAAALIKKSLEVMPANVVIDHSEPNPGGGSYRLGGQEFTAYSDGILHEYVEVLYLAGDKKAANDLATTVCEQLESIFNYFDKSDASIVMDENNMKDLYAAMDAYFTMYSAVADPDYGQPDSKLANRMQNKLNQLYSGTIKSIVSDLKEKGEDYGESVRRNSSDKGLYTSRMYAIEDYTTAMAVHYGMLEDPTTAQPQVAPRGGQVPTPSAPPGGQAPPMDVPVPEAEPMDPQ